MLGSKPETRAAIKGDNNVIVGSQPALNSVCKSLASDFDKINNEGLLLNPSSKNKNKLSLPERMMLVFYMGFVFKIDTNP